MKFREVRLSKKALQDLQKEASAGRLTRGNYPYRVERSMKSWTDAAYAVSTSSGTMALKIALDTIGVGRDDLVIVPDITFVACASVVQELGATPVFVDVDEDFVIDMGSTVQAVANFGRRIKAIMPVRLGGVDIPEWVFDFNIPVVVDSAHAIKYHDPRAAATCYSFHASKIVSGAEGGCLVTNHDVIADKARRLRSFGFAEGSRIASELGYKGMMANLSAVVISSNLSRLNGILRKRRQLLQKYNKALGLNNRGLGMYMVLVDDPDAVCAKIPAVRHYPMPLSEMITGTPFNPRAKEITKHLISLPFHEYLVDIDCKEVCNTVKHHLVTRDEHGIYRSKA